MPAPAVTLIDVAKAAGVSPITVSRALNEPQLVKPATLAKVQDAVKRTGYVKNMLAGGLASSRSKLVALVLPTISTQTFADMVQGATDRLTAAGYQLLLGIVGYETWREDVLVETILSRRPDGVILTGALHTDSTRQRLRQIGTPVVETWELTPHPIDMVIGFSHEEVGHACARHLLERGYRRFGMLTANDPRAGQRTQGFQVALAKHGLNVVCAQQMQAPGGLPQGRLGAVKLLDEHPELDAIFCSSDTLAHGVLIEAQSRGLRVPEDLAIMGFGDLNFSGYTNPPLSTVKVDGARIGALSAQALLDRLNGDESAERIVNTGFELIQRGST
ncbi:MAG TPA: LacI family DNA-binding transcriptional regulator [Duganella sp.]|nr:LacI family DNA-binding transcriptional regulator [Duganella sp.]